MSATGFETSGLNAECGIFETICINAERVISL